MSEDKNPQDIAQQLAQQVQQASGDAIPQSSSSGEEPSMQDKIQAAMTQGQESGLLNSESLQDGSMQEKVKEAMEKGQAPGGFLNKLMGGEVNNPLSSYGNNFGNAIEEKLSPVGKYAGKGFETIGAPVGGIVDPLVGGVMRSGGAFGEAVGVGSGNMDKKKAAEAEERERMKKEIGGKEQTGDNPLGL
ncbi:hypothetical protein GJ744_011961 [Endocarpon pusillum]|uniref:Uncharacterized protein n=1 Tax=Endocarpon pusillum TaxID=364733 RepID=A0A8H7APE7_9EURO|nr:hypothetical protein GJ744_011961 [Endocarpon pusillum]